MRRVRRYDIEPSPDKTNHRLNVEIERYIEQMDGTYIGEAVKNMYGNGTSYEVICDLLGWDYTDYEED